MAFSNTFDTTNPGSAVSNREDLTDVLTILAPEETPVLSSASKKRSGATFTEWTVDALSAPSTAGVREGADVGQTIGNDADPGFVDKFGGRARLGNYVQKFRRAFQVSDLQDAVESVGPAKIAQAEAKAIRELKRDVEATLLGTQDRSVEDGVNTPYGLRGLGGWIDDTNTAGGGNADVPDNFKTPASSVYDISTDGAFTEAALNGLISSIYRETGSTNNLMLVADTGLRRTIADFARVSAGATENIRSVNYDGNKAEIKLSVELYQSDHGIVSIVNMNPDTAPATIAGGTDFNDGYLINPEYYGVHELIPMGSTRLPNLGGGDRGFCDCSLTLGVYHPQAHGKITQ
tara:strand:- start:633 stop:1673 length:1041 start_codon:yes stop_codon:yes gene_type:complete